MSGNLDINLDGVIIGKLGWSDVSHILEPVQHQYREYPINSLQF